MIPVMLGRTEWMEQGVCLKSPEPDLWFDHGSQRDTGSSPRTVEAVRICRTCPVQMPCLQWAVETGETWGVWGGKTQAEIAAIRRGVKVNLEAHAMSGESFAPRTPPQITEKCGTRRGYERHRRRNEHACEACLASERTRDTKKRAKSKAQRTSTAKDAA